MTVSTVYHSLGISTHALREEGDEELRNPSIPRGISTHALREEGDLPPLCVGIVPTNFYPRPPRGGRPGAPLREVCVHTFLPTPSARRATLSAEDKQHFLEISTHALREEGDFHPPTLSCRWTPHFYPRPPRGGRLELQMGMKADSLFLPTPSARRATAGQLSMSSPKSVFLPTPSARRAT